MSDAMKDEMRLLALEHSVCRLSALMMVATGQTPEQISAGTASLAAHAGTQIFKGFDPAMSDHVTAEYEAAMTRLLEMQKLMAKSLRQP